VAFTTLPCLDEAAHDLGWQVLEIPAGKALTINVHESYDGIPAAYGALMHHVKVNSIPTKGWARHVYLSPPGQPIHVQVQIDLS
jgi:effector-binding domain-containing protein